MSDNKQKKFGMPPEITTDCERFSWYLARATKRLAPEHVKDMKDFGWKWMYDKCDGFSEGKKSVGSINRFYYIGVNADKMKRLSSERLEDYCRHLRNNGRFVEQDELHAGANANHKDSSFLMITDSYVYLGLRSAKNVWVYEFPNGVKYELLENIAMLAYKWFQQDGHISDEMVRVNPKRFGHKYYYNWKYSWDFGVTTGWGE